MRITSMSARVLAVMMVAGSAVAFADSYQWSGGDGSWADATKWNPNGVPGTAAGDIATFPVRATQTVTVDADTSLHHVDLAAKVPNVLQTFNITSGNTLTLDDFRLYKQDAADHLTICGGGTLALTNQPFYASGTINPVKVTVSGAGTVFSMPKDAASGLYIGSVDENYPNSPDVFHVTAGATAIVANATCVGNVINYGRATSIGRLVVDDGGYFYGGKILFIGRGATVPGGVVCAVTNATLEAEKIGLGAGWHHEFIGSNAVVRAASIEFPLEENISNNAVRYLHMDFEDSTFEATNICLIEGCSFSTGMLSRCVLTCDNLKGCIGISSRSSLVDIVDSCVTCKEVRVSGVSASNNVLRAVRSDIACDSINLGYDNSLQNTLCVEGGSVRTGKFRAGHMVGATEARYEQHGGLFVATNAVLAGCYNSRHCGASFKGVSFSAPLIACGDSIAVVEDRSLRSTDAWMEFADMERMEVGKLFVGVGSLGAHMLVTNSSMSVTYDTNDSTLIGRDAGATSNVLELVDSTLSQTGGNVFVGQRSGATNNTLRLVRSTFDFKTVNSKGDVMLGVDAGANGNRVELEDHSTFKYDRAWMAVGHNGASNVWSMSGGSTLQAPNTQFRLGGSGNTAKGNRLVLGGGSTFAVKAFYMYYNAVLEVSGTGNTMTLGSASDITDGLSYLFRPCEEASDTPMLTINQVFQYSVNRKIHVDVANAGIGRHVLLTSTSALAEPAIGSSVILENVPRNRTAQVFRSADTKSLVCSVSPTGTTIIFR